MPSEAQQVGRRRRERAGCGRECAGEAVMRERRGARLIRHGAGDHRVLERHQQPEVAGRGVHGADEGDQEHERDVLDLREGEPARRHQDGAEQEQVAQVVARAEEPDRERRHRRAEQRRRRHDADPERIEADLRQIGRQDDHREPVAEAAHPARRVEKENVPSAVHRSRFRSLPMGSDGLAGRHCPDTFSSCCARSCRARRVRPVRASARRRSPRNA